MRVTAVLLGLAALATASTDLDFEFDENQDVSSHSRRPRRYVYDPNNSLCAAVSCGARSVCAVYRGARALCVPRDRLQTAPSGPPAPAPALPALPDNSLDDDVFYDSSRDLDPEPERCVGCGGVAGTGAGTGFLCGSDNRTYSSLCRLDLHNCVRRTRPAVTLACHGFCPCLPAPSAVPPAPPAPRAPPAPPGPPSGKRPRRTQRRKHDKFKLYAHETSRRHRLEMDHNEVLPTKEKSHLATDASTDDCEMESMASRLLDWFSVLMEQAMAKPPPPTDHQFPTWCLPEVRWMFSHLDTDGDGVLSADNLYALRHDERERCLRPFLSSCSSEAGAGDEGGEGGEGSEEEVVEAGGGVSRSGWCSCLRRATRPCTRLARAHPHPPPGSYVPRCDWRGYYQPRQCHAALRLCWCVDRHGVERPASRARGLTHCPPGDKLEGPIPDPPVSAVDDQGALSDDEDEDSDGSGQGELPY